MRYFRIVLVVAVAAFLIAAATASSSVSQKQAENAATKAAIHYVHRFGIYFQPDAVHSGCGKRAGGWRCFVRMNGKECSGTLRLRPNLHAYRYRISCGE